MSELTKTCGACHLAKPYSEFYADATHAGGVHSNCKACVKAASTRRYWAFREQASAYNKAYYAEHKEEYYVRSRQLRERVLKEYGGKCACCGETTPEFLGIDHVNNDGEAHRRELKGYGRSINRWLKLQGFPHDGRFQLLCHNCNIAKGCYGGCPHQGTVPGRRQGTKPWYG